ncbi:MAG: hypothetical protein ACYS0E_14265 [Planctomycetota bacterium]|jgi:hypothetical protein
MRRLLAVLLLGSFAIAGDVQGLDAPAKSPLAKRKRAAAAASWHKGRVVHEAVRKGEKPSGDVIRQALLDLENAVNLYEAAQIMEWSAVANREEAECVRNWAGLRAIAPAPEPPTDPTEKKRWESKRRGAAKERARDARRFVTKLLQARRHRKVFQRCSRCDGRGELRSAFGDKSTCKTCGGFKNTTNRKNLLKGFWMAHTPFFRADARNIARVNQVLRNGVRGEKRLGPYVHSSSIDGKIEDHGWWYRVRTKEKVIAEGEQSKPTERAETYIVMNVGRAWWVHSGRLDRDLLVIPEG